jgi:ABC-type dipeptide/oligopeptide/nickel transport system ATPase subunit
VSCPLFAAIWRAPLQQSDFSLVLVGQSGSGKSSLAALAQAHFGASMWDRNSRR